jgi:hypothetical protein
MAPYGGWRDYITSSPNRPSSCDCNSDALRPQKRKNGCRKCKPQPVHARNTLRWIGAGAVLVTVAMIILERL